MRPSTTRGPFRHSLSTRIGGHIRSNVVGYIAIFLFAMSGTATALTGSNTVFSDDIVNGQVRNPDLADNSVGTTKIADGRVFAADLAPDSVGSGKVANESLTSDDLGNNSVDGSEIVAGAVDTEEVEDNGLLGLDINDNTLTGDDIQESSLGQVPSALLGGFGRTGAEGGLCDPESTTFVTCAATETLNVPPGARALVLARVRAETEIASDSGVGDCRLGTSSLGAVPNTGTRLIADSNDNTYATLVGVTPPLPPVATSFGIDCNQVAIGAIRYVDVSASVLLISAN
jgi:hypothetical protein